MWVCNNVLPNSIRLGLTWKFDVLYKLSILFEKKIDHQGSKASCVNVNSLVNILTLGKVLLLFGTAYSFIMSSL